MNKKEYYKAMFEKVAQRKRKRAEDRLRRIAAAQAAPRKTKSHKSPSDLRRFVKRIPKQLAWKAQHEQVELQSAE